MADDTVSTTPSRRAETRYIVVSLALVLCGAVAALAVSDRVANIYAMYFSYDQFKDLYYDKLGLSNAHSDLFTVITQFIYGVAWIPLTAFIVSWRLNFQKVLTGFIAWIVVYGTAPAAILLMGDDVCFSQSSGDAQKWFIQDQAGNILLYDSGGFTSSGESKKVVTQQICRDYMRQQTGNRPQLLTGSLDQIEFFDSVTGTPKVWYNQGTDGSIQLFDKPGFDPASGEELNRINRDIVLSLQAAHASKARISANTRPHTAPEPTPPSRPTNSASSAPVLLHNGSTVYLVGEGSVRRIYYKQPRQGMLAAGAAPHSLLFEGAVSQTGAWRGSAYIFTKRCGAFPYAVQGYLDPMTGIINLTGAAPRIDANCRVTSVGGSKNDTLIFTPIGD